MKTKIIKNDPMEQPLPKFPCARIHDGLSGHGNKSWKGAVAIFVNDCTAILVIIPNTKMVRDYPFGTILDTEKVLDKYWKPFTDKIELDFGD